MRVTPPLTITDAILTSSTAAEPGAGETAWNAATAYTAGDTAYLASNHTRYERLISGTTATSPHLDAVNWSPIGPTNRWAMFDLLRNTGTVLASPLTVVLTPGQRVDTIGLAGLIADEVTISVTSGGSPVFSETYDLRTRNTVSWYGYFHGPFSFRTAVYQFGLPPYTNAVITVTITRASGNVTCGSLILGTSVYIGEAERGAESDALNFSRIERDEFGNATLVPRRTVPKATLNVIADKTNVNRIRALRDELNAVPALWSTLDDQTDDYFEAVFLLGIFKRLLITLEQPAADKVIVAMDLEEV